MARTKTSVAQQIVHNVSFKDNQFQETLQQGIDMACHLEPDEYKADLYARIVERHEDIVGRYSRLYSVVIEEVCRV